MSDKKKSVHLEDDVHSAAAHRAIDEKSNIQRWVNDILRKELGLKPSEG